MDDGVENHALEVHLEFIDNLGVHFCPAIVHRHHEAFDGQGRIHSVLYQTDGLEKLSETLQCEEFGLDRNQH